MEGEEERRRGRQKITEVVNTTQKLANQIAINAGLVVASLLHDSDPPKRAFYIPYRAFFRGK